MEIEERGLWSRSDDSRRGAEGRGGCGQNEGVKQRGAEEERGGVGGCRRCKGEGKQGPEQAARALRAWYRGVNPTLNTPPPSPLPHSIVGSEVKLSYVGLTASVCCVLAVCLDSAASLSQQLHNRWLKEGPPYRRGPDRRSGEEDSAHSADTHTHRHTADTCK